MALVDLSDLYTHITILLLERLTYFEMNNNFSETKQLTYQYPYFLF